MYGNPKRPLAGDPSQKKTAYALYTQWFAANSCLLLRQPEGPLVSHGAALFVELRRNLTLDQATARVI